MIPVVEARAFVERPAGLVVMPAVQVGPEGVPLHVDAAGSGAGHRQAGRGIDLDMVVGTAAKGVVIGRAPFDAG